MVMRSFSSEAYLTKTADCPACFPDAFLAYINTLSNWSATLTPGVKKFVSPYGPLEYRTAARTLFLRPYLAHFCPVFSRFFAVFSVVTPGFQKVAPKDRGAVP